MAIQLSQPHDGLFRAILADRQRADSILRTHLHPHLLPLLADALPQPLEGSFVDGALRASYGDKLLQVQLRDGRTAFVYALLEHKSYSDPGTALQVWDYKLRIWRQYAGDSARKLRTLPPIVPLVFYHGHEPWNAPPSIAAMLGTEDQFLQALEPSFGYFLRNLNELREEELAADPAARAGLLLRHSHRSGPEAMQRKLALLPQILAPLPDGSHYQRQVVVYVMNVWHVPQPAVSAAAEEALPGRGETMVGQVVQELLDQGEAKGLAKGRAEGLTEGRVEGRVEGLTDSLTWLLEDRFGQLPEALRNRIADASQGQLRAWFTAALGASSLGTVFNGHALD